MQFKRNLCIVVFTLTQLFYLANTHAASYGSATWDESDNRILRKTVCANHEYGSIKYRKCRVEASKHFVQRCKSFKNKYSKASSKNRTKYENGKSKFCYAARHFKIVD